MSFDPTINKAREMALALHEGQMYGSVPYSSHLEDVSLTLHSFGHTNPELIAAAWLHDALEDTDITKEGIKEAVGQRVADLVDAVTDDPAGESRKERKARPMRIIPTVPGAVLLKLADRIANVKRALTSDNPRYIKMYRGEQGNFREALYVEGVADAMWQTLEELLEVPEWT